MQGKMQVKTFIQDRIILNRILQNGALCPFFISILQGYNMKKIMKIFVVVVFVSTLFLSVYAEKKIKYALHGIIFESSLIFSQPSKIGVDALLMVYPKNSRLGKEIMGITAVLYTKETQKNMGMDNVGLMNYTKTVFMGAAASGKTIERVFSGKKIKGEVVVKKIPVSSTVEIYIVNLSNGDKIGLGFNYTTQMKEVEVGQVIDEIGVTMKE